MSQVNSFCSEKRASPKRTLCSFSPLPPRVFLFPTFFGSSPRCFCTLLLTYHALLHRFRPSIQDKLCNFSLRTSWALRGQRERLVHGASPCRNHRGRVLFSTSVRFAPNLEWSQRWAALRRWDLFVILHRSHMMA